MKQAVNEISPNELHQAMTQDESIQLVDVRTHGEFQSQHIEDSLLIPLDEISADRLAMHLDKGAGDTEPIYLTCGTGIRAKQAARKLQAEGLRNITLLSGGLNAWNMTRLPVVRKSRLPSLEQQARILTGVLMLLIVIKAVLISPWFYSLIGLLGLSLIVSGFSACNRMSLWLSRLPWNREQTAASRQPVAQ